MNILALVISSIIILAALAVGFFVGKKSRFLVQLTKFLIYLATSVGIFFIVPIMVNNIEQVNELVPLLEIEMIYFGMYAILLAFVCLIVNVAFIPWERKLTKEKRVKKEKGVIYKTKTDEDKKIIKERNKRALKKARYQKKIKYAKEHRVSRIFAGVVSIFSTIIFVIVGFVAFKPYLNIFKLYDNSAIGIIDDMIKGKDKIEDYWDINDKEEDEIIEPNFVYNIGDIFNLSNLQITIEVEELVGTGEFIIDEETQEVTDEEIMELATIEVTLDPISFIATNKDGEEINLQEAFDEEGLITIVATYEYNDETFTKTFTVKVNTIETEDPIEEDPETEISEDNE